MKAKLIYREGSSYFGGINPYGEDWKTIVEYEGNYYELHSWGNYTTSGETIKKIDFEAENIPEEYKRTEMNTNYSLRHGNGREIEINLTKYDVYYVPEELKELHEIELKKAAKEKIDKEIESDPSLDYNRIIEEADLTEEQYQIARKIIDKMESELTDKYLELKDYRPIIENLVSIAKGESVIVTHTYASNSRPDDDMISINEIKSDDFSKYGTLATSGLHSEHFWGARATEPEVFSIQGKQIKLKNGTSYLGSYWRQGYNIDVMLDKEGNPYINPNVYISWVDSAQYDGILDMNLPVDRFEIETGEIGSFESYNNEVKERKNEKRRFFREVMEEAKKEFGISEAQAKVLLDFAGTVTALNIATNFEKGGLSTDQAVAMLRKRSHRGMEGVLDDANIEYPPNNFDIIQRAAETLAYIHTLQEGQEDKKKNNINMGKIKNAISLNKQDRTNDD